MKLNVLFGETMLFGSLIYGQEKRPTVSAETIRKTSLRGLETFAVVSDYIGLPAPLNNLNTMLDNDLLLLLRSNEKTRSAWLTKESDGIPVAFLNITVRAQCADASE